jgi:vacuolar-type H+-ATPase subunit I/STV1
MSKFKTQFKDIEPYKGKTMDDTLVTRPDMARTIPELLRNHARGIGLGIHEHQGQYFEEEVIPKVQDFTDLDDRKRQLRERFQEIDKKVKDEREALKKARKDALSDQTKKVDANPSEEEKRPQNDSE